MNTIGKLLNVLFHGASPERILESLCHSTETFLLHDNQEQLSREMFLDHAETMLSGHSPDEQRLLYDWLRERNQRWKREEGVPDSFLIPLISFGQEALTVYNEEPRCKIDQALRWREVYLDLGQDTIICPYLAYRDLFSGYQRKDFVWPAVIQTDDSALQQMFADGLAENHAHLNGSTQSFALTWCRLMNFPEDIETDLTHFSTKLQYRISRGTNDNMMPLTDLLVAAALLRSILFRAVHSGSFFARMEDRPAGCKDRPPEDDPSDSHDASSKGRPFDSLEAFRNEYLNSFSPLAKVQTTAAWLRQCCGCMIPFPDGECFCLDYALEPDIFAAAQDSPQRILAGERHLLYQCAQACLTNNFTEFEECIFYLYLLLKLSFRSEMIQVNRQVGFQNFADYQARKDDAWEKNLYWWEANRMSLSGPLKQQQHIKSLETRFGPADTAQGNIDRVASFDRAKRFADCSLADAFVPQNYEFNYETDVEQFRDEKYFFVFHFSKVKDDIDPTKLQEWDLVCRQEHLRASVKQKSLALAKALSNSAYLCYRVRGIDAAASEIGCRPENFAVAFRFLGDIHTAKFASACALLPPPHPHLSKTYHAGEDFLDIADGLRSIDEAIHFLDLQRGSRIGHALAMGVSPDIHYCTKNYTIVTTKQDRLDDLVWLLYRGPALGVSIDPQQKYSLVEEAHRLFREIYADAVHQHGWNCTLDEYYCSAKLRGDDPSLYRSMKYQKADFSICPYDAFLENASDPSLRTYRTDPRISGLYYYYHYGVKEKKRGMEKVTVQVDSVYIQLMHRMQNAMQKFVEHSGLIVECNPSSNVLIGTFQDYKNHPVFRFNNTGLVYDQQGHDSCPQLHICVNTDDLGVFDTSLEFEYALLYQTLREHERAAGESAYRSRDIINYLDNLRKMGLQAVFPPAP